MNSASKNNRLLDTTFRLSLYLKAADGVLELIGGALLLVVPINSIQQLARAVTQHELSTDSADFIATHILHTAGNLTSSGAIFGAAYLLLHGVVKVVLVVAVLRQQLWAYPWMIGFLSVFILYQVYRLGYHFSPGLLGLTLFDIFVVWLTVLEYQRHSMKNHLRPSN